jgi:hypothetical protein
MTTSAQHAGINQQTFSNSTLLLPVLQQNEHPALHHKFGMSLTQLLLAAIMASIL